MKTNNEGKKTQLRALWFGCTIGRMTSCIAFFFLPSCSSSVHLGGVRGGGFYFPPRTFQYPMHRVTGTGLDLGRATAVLSAGTNTGSSRDVTSHRARRERGMFRLWSSIFMSHTPSRATHLKGRAVHCRMCICVPAGKLKKHDHLSIRFLSLLAYYYTQCPILDFLRCRISDTLQ